MAKTEIADATYAVVPAYFESARLAKFYLNEPGRDAVRAGFAEVFTTFPDSQWEEGIHLVSGDRGVSEWVFRGTRLDGSRVEVNGCDLFTLRDGRIAVKNSYRKNRTAI